MTIHCLCDPILSLYGMSIFLYDPIIFPYDPIIFLYDPIVFLSPSRHHFQAPVTLISHPHCIQILCMF